MAKDYMKELERVMRGESAETDVFAPDQVKLADLGTQEPSREPAQQQEVEAVNEQAESPYMQEAPKEKSYEEKLIEELRGIRASSKEELAKAREDDKRRYMYANLAKALGGLGAAEVQRKAGVKAGLQPFQAAQIQSGAKDVMADRKADIQALLDEYKITKAGKTKDKKDIYKVGDDLVKVGDDGQVTKLYGSEKKKAAEPTQGEKTIDREFAKEYNKWSTGGKADYEVNAKIFKDAIRDLRQGKVDTGPIEGIGARTPVLRTDARAMEDRVRKAINGMLRATLGAQFTEKEGERIFQQTFDPFKDQNDNIKAMELELAKLEKRKDDIESMGKYYTKNKTISGYEVPEATTGPSESVIMVAPNGQEARVRADQVQKYLDRGARIKE